MCQRKVFFVSVQRPSNKEGRSAEPPRFEDTGPSQYVIYVTLRAGKISFRRQRFVGMPTETCCSLPPSPFLQLLLHYTHTYTRTERAISPPPPRVRLYLYRYTIYEFNRADFQPPKNVDPVRRQDDVGTPINSHHMRPLAVDNLFF